MSNKHRKPAGHRVAQPNASMSMSAHARAGMRMTERAVYKYYNDMGKHRGNCTWGAGILAHKGVCSEEELSRQVSTQSVEVVFSRKVAAAEDVVRRGVHVPLNQAQFDALCSLAYNAGAGGTGDTFKLLNKNDFPGAAANISMLVKVSVTENGIRKKIVAPGLIKRRAEESAPFRIPSTAPSNAN